jgi:hypothetical protein
MSRRISITVLPLFFCLFIYCQLYNPTSHTVSPNKLGNKDTLNIHYNETIIIDDENTSLTFDSLLGDSRCPKGVTCIWEGNAQLGFKLNSHEFSLNSHKGFRTDTTVLAYTISLMKVYPYPHIDSLYVPEDYSADISLEQIYQ